MEKQCSKCGEELTVSGSGSMVCLPCFAGLFEGEENDEAELDQDFAEADRYEVGAVLGRGANGTVYRAYDRKLKREVAVKRLNALIADRRAEERFQLELETIASLEHMHVIPILDHGELEGRAFYVMRYIADGTLADAKSERLGVKEVVRLMMQVVGAVAYAHARGILHRDLKPENILLEGGEHAYVTDFGLAKRFTEDGGGGLSLTGEVFGTPAYMAPEQARGEQGKVTTATDVFALGGILFEMLTGRRAFSGQDSHVLLKQVIEDEVKFAPEEKKRIGADLVTVCLKCLEKEPELRYATAEEFGRDLKRFLEGLPVRARPISNLARLGRWAWRHPVQSLSYLTMIAVFAGLFFSVVTSRNELLRERETSRLERKRAERQLYYANLSLIGENAKNFDFVGLTKVLPELESYEDSGFELDYWKSRLVSPERAMPTVPGGASVLSISSDGKRYLTGGPGGVVTVFEWEGERVASRDYGDKIFRAFFLEEGAVAAGLSNGNKVEVWEVEGGEGFPVPEKEWMGIQEVPGREDSVVGLTTQGELVFWKWRTGEIWKQMVIKGDFPDALDHACFVIEGDEMIGSHGEIWNLETGEKRRVIDDLNWFRDDRLVLSDDGQRAILDRRLINLKDGREIFRLRTGGHDSQNIFLRNGMIASSSGDSGIIVWQPKARDRQHPFCLDRNREEPVSSLALSPDGRWLLSGTYNGGEVDRWRVADFQDRSVLQSLDEDRATLTRTSSVDFSEDGRYLATATDLGVVEVWDLELRERVFEKRCHEEAVCGAFFLNRSKWVFSAGGDGRCAIWDWRTGEKVQDFGQDESAIWGMAVFAKGTLVSVAYRHGKVMVWDGESGEVVAKFQGGFTDTCAMAFSPDGELLFMGGWGEDETEGKILRFRTGEVISELQGHERWVSDAVFYDGGKKIMTTSADLTCRAWDVETGAQLQVLEGHDGTLNAVRISKDGRRVFTVSDDETTRVWDTRNGRQLLSIPSAYGPMHYLALSPDDRQLAVSTEGAVIIWETHSQEE